MRLAVLLVLAACASPTPRSSAPRPAPRPHDLERQYTIWLGGARVGTASETEAWTATGVVLERTEALQFLRGDAPMSMTTTIEIVASIGLIASRVTWTERVVTPADRLTTRRGEARRDAKGWQVTIDGVRRRLPGSAQPAELVPLLLRRDGGFHGEVFLPARGFVGGRGRVDAVAPARLVARLELDAGPVAEATIDLADDGIPARVVDGEGVIAVRATVAEARAPFAPVDLIAATSLPLLGHRGQRMWLDADGTLPAVPGQRAFPAAGGLELELGATLPGDLPAGPSAPDRMAEITALVDRVQRRIVPDLGAGPTSSRDASIATAGDCTTFALAYAALAERLAIPTRVVTGLRIDGDRLIRHRWAVSWTGQAWVAVDAAFGAAPAGGDLVGLAIHDADDGGLLAGEAALTRIHSAGWQ